MTEGLLGQPLPEWDQNGGALEDPPGSPGLTELTPNREKIKTTYFTA